jgi:hypothetical protein
VDIACTQYGDPVTGPWGTTTLWDRIDSEQLSIPVDRAFHAAMSTDVSAAC